MLLLWQTKIAPRSSNPIGARSVTAYYRKLHYGTIPRLHRPLATLLQHPTATSTATTSRAHIERALLAPQSHPLISQLYYPLLLAGAVVFLTLLSCIRSVIIRARLLVDTVSRFLFNTTSAYPTAFFSILLIFVLFIDSNLVIVQRLP